MATTKLAPKFDSSEKNVPSRRPNIANNFSEKRMTKWDWIDSFIYSFQKHATLLDLG